MANLARRILDAIEQYPEAFDMDSWHGGRPIGPDDAPACGTTMCVAGWAAHLEGWTLNGIDAGKDGVWRNADDVAAVALGLDDASADLLFYSTAERAREMLEEMAEA